MVGFAYPIYGSDLPVTMIKFIENLPKVDDKPAFIFTTMMLFSGDGAIVAMRKLRKKGFKVKQAVNIIMPNNVKLPYIIFRHLKIQDEEGIKKIQKRAGKRIDKLVDRIVAGKNWRLGRDPISIAGGLTQRIPMRITGWAIMARPYFVDMETCTECMICVNFCPVNNITFKDGEFEWGKSCIACLRCYHMCPEDAVQHKKGTLNRKRYIRYKGPGDGFSLAKLKK
jgi:ferredoxin